MGQKVSRKWVMQNVGKLYGFGGQITKRTVVDIPVPRGGYNTSLTSNGKRMVESGEFGGKFNIELPGVGWVNCWGY